jgi:uncharacterized protein involved in exopolysaccharide biosynthesis
MTEAQPPNPQQQPVIFYGQPQLDTAEDEIDLIELFRVLLRRWLFLMGFPLVCTLVAVYVTLYVMPEIYKSTAVIRPAEGGSGGLAGKLGALSSMLPIPIDLPGGGEDKANVENFLKSRTLKERLIKKFDLLPRLYPDDWDADTDKWTIEDPAKIPTIVSALQEDALKKIFNVSTDKKSGLITIAWSDEEPAFAKSMLDRVVKELRYYLDNEYESDAKREREFVEGRLAIASRDLEHWERQVPSRGLTLDKIARERLAAQTVYTELRKQLEIARITEAKEITSFRVLDQPFVPVKRDKPKRAQICALTLVASGFLAVFLIFAQHAVVNAVQRSKSQTPPDPDTP